MAIGKVYIIGVGPGDYKLMTLKAVECIAKADVIVYDRLIGSRVLSYARKDAELVYVGKMPDRHAVPQEGINEILVKKALEGKLVARVKGGDPFVFGRGGEEAEELIKNNITFEIVPGVTSAIAVPAYAGIPVTHRDLCSSFHIITGHERAEKESSVHDYKTLAKVEGTLIFLMGVKNLKEICSNLIDHGKDASTPAAVIEKGTTASQRVVTGELKDIAEKVAEAGVRSPAVTIIGAVATMRNKLQWFPKGKLAGKRVVVTRSREQASKLVQKIEALGGEAIELPTIRIEEPCSYKLFDKTLKELDTFQWLVFTSINGVNAFFKRMKEQKLDIRRLSGIKLCAVGEATADELGKLGLIVDYVPEKFTTAELLKGLLERVMPGERILMARADIADPELSEGLITNGNEVVDLEVYRTLLYGDSRADAARIFGEGNIDYITFASSSTVKNFVEILGKENLSLVSDSKIICIGPVTAKTAEEYGLMVHAVADRYTIEGMIDKLTEC